MSSYPEKTEFVETVEPDYDEPVQPARFDSEAVRHAAPAVPVSRFLARRPKSGFLIIAALLAAVLGAILGSYLSLQYMKKQGQPQASVTESSPPPEVAESPSPQEENEQPQSDTDVKVSQPDYSPKQAAPSDEKADKDEQPVNRQPKEKERVEKKETRAEVKQEVPAQDSPGFDTKRSSRELQEAFYNWLEANKQGDVDRQLKYYNARVDAFYRKRNTSISSVREEKSRVLGRATGIRIEASEPEIRISDNGQQATIRYRKRYTIEGAEVNRRGEVLQELQWRRINSRWRIVSERDVKVLR